LEEEGKPVSGFRPDERLGMLVVDLDIISNGCFKFAGAAEYATNGFYKQNISGIHKKKNRKISMIWMLIAT
jgi:hypothetical protein